METVVAWGIILNIMDCPCLFSHHLKVREAGPENRRSDVPASDSTISFASCLGDRSASKYFKDVMKLHILLPRLCCGRSLRFGSIKSKSSVPRP